MGISDTHEETSFLICISLRALRAMEKKYFHVESRLYAREELSSGVEWRPSLRSENSLNLFKASVF